MFPWTSECQRSPIMAVHIMSILQPAEPQLVTQRHHIAISIPTETKQQNPANPSSSELTRLIPPHPGIKVGFLGLRCGLILLYLDWVSRFSELYLPPVVAAVWSQGFNSLFICLSAVLARPANNLQGVQECHFRKTLGVTTTTLHPTLSSPYPHRLSTEYHTIISVIL